MSFVSNIASNPSSSVYGQPAPNRDDTLGIINNLKDREMQDFKNKAGFMSDLSIKQDRLRRVYGLDSPPDNPMQDAMQNQQLGDAKQKSSDAASDRMQAGMQQMEDPSTPTGLTAGQRGEYQLGKQKLAQQGQMGEETLGIKQQQADLNQEKSDSIHNQKLADLQLKTNEFKSKMELAQQQLQQKTQAGEDTIELHRQIAENAKGFHDATMARQRLQFDRSLQQKDEQFKKVNDFHQKQIDLLTKKNKDAQNTKTETKIGADGQSRTVTKKSGAAADTVEVTGKDGQTYMIPGDKVDEWNQNHAPDDNSGDSDSGDSGDSGGDSGGGASE